MEAPGKAWALGNGHEISFGHGSNVSNEVRRFDVALSFANNTYTPTLSPNGHFGANELYKNVIRDENHDGSASKLHTMEEFTDKQGRVVLKRTYADVLEGGVAVSEAEPHDTYYVYDDFGNLTYVLPPKMEASTATLVQLDADMGALGYRYVYDHRNRLVEKQVPGKEKESIIYNRLDQPILTQDANQRADGEWLFTKYDAFGRVAYTGKATDGRERHLVQASVDSLTVPLWVVPSGTANTLGNASVHYGNGAYPNSGSMTVLTEVLTINYYDNYDFLDSETGMDLPASVFGKNVENYNNAAKIRTKGLATGSKVKVLDPSSGPGQTFWVSSVTGYDNKGRAVYGHSRDGYLGTDDIVGSELDFTGKAVRTRTSHTRNNTTIATIDNFTYDHVGRLLSHTQCIGDENMGEICPESGDLDVNLPVTGTVDGLREATGSITVTDATLLPGTQLRISNGSERELIAYNEYDGLGQLRAKKVGGIPGTDYQVTQGLQTVDYSYNVRGWLKGINGDIHDDNDLFNFALRYNDPSNGTALFNGNISQALWDTQSPVSGSNPISSQYTYAYDALNRITSALDNTTNYNLEQVEYDRNGNIVRLKRKGHTEMDGNGLVTAFGIMDDLAYTYDSGNRLLGVTDGGSTDRGFVDGNTTGNDFGYDANGNMVRDLNKGIGTGSNDGIIYNHLNLPINIEIDNTENTGNIEYIYDATGTKLRKIATDTGESSVTTTDYAGNFIYENNVLQFFIHPEGYVRPDTGGGYDYIYQYRDHLGNIRLSYTEDPTDPGQPTIIEENNYYPFGLQHKGYNNVVNGTEHPFTYNGKEEQNELGLNWLDYGWRNYDPSLGRWFSVDNLAEKYSSSSPYHYAGNNPILYFDIDGNEFTESAWEWVNRLIANIDSRQERNNEGIAEKRARLEEGGLSNRQEGRLNRQISRLEGNNAELESVRGEIATLEVSDQVYDVVTDNGGTERDVVGNSTTTNSTSINFTNGNVEITVSSGTGLDLFAHELKHAHQFDIGEASFGERGGTGFSFLLDKNDELAGYRRQALFGSNGGVSNINSLPDNYSSLPTGPVNIHNLNPAVSNVVRTGNNFQLQALANQRKQAFRVNNRTFIPNNN